MVGESVWLEWCEREFGWKRRAAYNHLNPEQLQKARDRDEERRAQPVHIEPATLNLGNPSVRPQPLDTRSDEEREEGDTVKCADGCEDDAEHVNLWACKNWLEGIRRFRLDFTRRDPLDFIEDMTPEQRKALSKEADALYEWVENVRSTLINEEDWKPDPPTPKGKRKAKAEPTPEPEAEPETTTPKLCRVVLDDDATRSKQQSKDWRHCGKPVVFGSFCDEHKTPTVEPDPFMPRKS